MKDVPKHNANEMFRTVIEITMNKGPWGLFCGEKSRLAILGNERKCSTPCKKKIAPRKKKA